MMRLIVDGFTLDLGQNAKVRIKRQSPAYLGSGVGVIKGDFSFPFDLPLTGVNRVALGFPDRLDNDERPRVNLPAELYVGPDRLIGGVLNVLSASRTTAKVALINHPLQDLTKVKLNDIDYGEINVASETELRNLMDATTVSPEDHDYIFLPVFNLALRESTGLTDVPVDSEFQNPYDFNGRTFRTNHDVSPFLRTQVVLQKAMAHAGYTIIDKLHALPELRRMVLLNNRSMRLGDDLALKMPLNFCVNDQTVADFIKQLCRIFCLAPFAGVGDNVIRLESLRGLVAAEPGGDWTNYASKEYSRENFDGGVSRFEYPESAYGDSYHYDYWEYDLKETTGVLRDFVDENDDIIPVPPGEIFYLEGRSAVSERRIFGENGALVPIGSFGRVFNEFGTEILAPSLFPAQSAHVFFYPTNFDRITVPSVAWSVSGITSEEEAGQSIIYSAVDNTQTRLSIYRGFQNTIQNVQYPMGCHNNYDSKFEEIESDVVSLNWLGNDGLYNRYWREWDAMLQRSAAVSQSFLLPLAEVLDFDFSKKVRVGNQNYFVRSLEFTVTTRGVSPAQCELLSVS